MFFGDNYEVSYLGFIICIFVLKLFVLCCLLQCFVLRPLLRFNRFKFLLSVLFLFYCFVCFALCLVCSVNRIVSPSVYYCYLPFVYNCKGHCHRVETPKTLNIVSYHKITRLILICTDEQEREILSSIVEVKICLAIHSVYFDVCIV
jgi:hypothetical protein